MPDAPLLYTTLVDFFLGRLALIVEERAGDLHEVAANSTVFCQ